MMRPQWIALAGGAIVGTLLFVSGAAADDFDTCDQQSGDVAIAACTRGITSGEYSGDRLAVLYNDRGVEYQNKGDLDRAIADYGEAIKDNPKFIRAYENRIKANVKKGEYDRAFADYSAVIELDPSFANFINRGMLYFEHGRYNLAIADDSEAIRLSPKEPFGWLNRCEAYVIQNKLQDALSDCNRSLELANVPETRRVRGIIYTKLGRYQLAISDFNDAIKAVPDFAEAFYARGVAKLKSGDERGGQADMAKAQSMNAHVSEDFKKYGLAL